ncbi:uncharacterized protein V6R79_004079 [Siganus canaliculatus]
MMETATAESQRSKQNTPHSSGEPSSEINPPSAAFSPNKISTLVLPLVTDSQRLIWIPSGQINLELDVAAELDKAFDRCPYLTQNQTTALAQSYSLHPDQVKVWFMVQRLRYGISWDCEDILKIQVEFKSCQGKEELERDTGGKFRQSASDGNIMSENVGCDQRLERKMKYPKNVETDTKKEPKEDSSQKHKMMTDLMEEKTAAAEEAAGQAAVEENTTGLTQSQVLDGIHWTPVKRSHQLKTSGVCKLKGESLALSPKPSGAFTSTYKCEQRGEMTSPAEPFSCSRIRFHTKTREQMGIMKMAFLHCLYPDREDYDQLMTLTGVPRSTLVQWYGDMRYQLKKKKPRWMNEDQYNQAVATIRYRQFLNKFAKGLQGKRRRASSKRNRNKDRSHRENENVQELPEQK